MPKINTRVTFNKVAAIAKIKAANNAALTVMGNQALQDVSQHVPKDQGALENSGLSSSDEKPLMANLQCAGILHMHDIFGMVM